MSSSCVVTVGNEILAGRIHDTNATWLSAELWKHGFPVVFRETVADEEEAVARAVRNGLDHVPVTVVTGGLGPTADDLTRHGVAHALGVPLELHAGALRTMEKFFRDHGRELPDRERVQALLPRGTRPLPNSHGTAPGMLLEVAGERLIVVLPGVPAEMKAMAREHLFPLLDGRADRGRVPERREVTVLGIPESLIGERLADLLRRGRNPTLGSYPRIFQVHLELTAAAGDPEEARTLLDRDVREIRRRLGPEAVVEGRVNLNEVVGRMLLERRRTIAVAESLTGGLLSDRLVAVPGISAVFTAGLVTYSNEAKERVLGVSPETLRAHGAVSAACAREMAAGARRVGGADIGVGTTGIAGPTGAVPGKPVGTVFIGLALGDEVVAEERHFTGSRSQVRERAAQWALNEVRLRLLPAGEGAA